MFLFLVYLQDFIWLSLSRISLLYVPSVYYISPFSIITYIEIGFITLFFSLASIILIKGLKPLPRLKTSLSILKVVVFIAFVINLLIPLILVAGYRYTSGGLTGETGIVYFIGQMLSFASFVIIIKQKHLGAEIPKILVIAFFCSLIVKIDGLASALTVAAFGIIAFNIKLKKPGRFLSASIFAVALFSIGLNSKYDVLPDYLTPQSMFTWIVFRFGIAGEQMYNFVSGVSSVGNEYSYFDLVSRSFSQRFDVIQGEQPRITYPRSVSEANYFDMHGTYWGGSSSGALLGTAYLGPFFLIPLLLFCFVFFQYFYRILEKVSILHMLAYVFLFKAIYANFSEILSIISLSSLLLIMFVFFSILEAPGRKPIYDGNDQ